MNDDNVVLLMNEAAGVVGETAGVSLPIKRPYYLSIDGMDGSSEFVVEAKLHFDAEWQEIQAVDTTAPSAMIAMDNPPTLVRVRRKTGTNQVIVYAQR